MKSPELTAEQLALILSLVESQKDEILEDLDSLASLGKASRNLLEIRFWQLAKIKELLTTTTTIATGSNEN
jgi:hypothetical protein